VALGTFAVVIGTVIAIAWQPWTANHFGYAVPGRDGLPTYVFENGRRYHTSQVCANADWCARDRSQQGIPRCDTQADLAARHEWPLTPADHMFTLFGAPQTIYIGPWGRGLPAPFIMADGPDCYVMYSLEGGP
ncbi:MAG TPA: hypothetical protein VF807_11085, partial [Ktedonobacterales bacterium]